jgi:hypothetical protein
LGDRTVPVVPRRRPAIARTYIAPPRERHSMARRCLRPLAQVFGFVEAAVGGSALQRIDDRIEPRMTTRGRAWRCRSR